MMADEVVEGDKEREQATSDSCKYLTHHGTAITEPRSPERWAFTAIDNPGLISLVPTFLQSA